MLVAQLLYNCKVLDTTGLLLFFSNYGKDANLYLNLKIRPKAKRALVNISEIYKIYKEIARRIKEKNKKTATHINKSRKNRP